MAPVFLHHLLCEPYAFLSQTVTKIFIVFNFLCIILYWNSIDGVNRFVAAGIVVMLAIILL